MLIKITSLPAKFLDFPVKYNILFQTVNTDYIFLTDRMVELLIRRICHAGCSEDLRLTLTTITSNYDRVNLMAACPDTGRTVLHWIMVGASSALEEALRKSDSSLVYGGFFSEKCKDKIPETIQQSEKIKEYFACYQEISSHLGAPDTMAKLGRARDKQDMLWENCTSLAKHIIEYHMLSFVATLRRHLPDPDSHHSPNPNPS